MSPKPLLSRPTFLLPKREPAKIVLRSDSCSASYEKEAAELAARLGISPLVALVLLARQMSDETKIRSFLAPTLREGIPAPGEMKNLKAACTRLLLAIENNERIAVFSDFDVDGIASASQLVPYLTKLGADVVHYAPNRFTEGYGLSKGAAEKLAHAGVKLLVTVDCGATNHEAVAFAKQSGMSVIVVDHHQMQGTSPADILVNPAQEGCPFQEYRLCAAGIVWFLLIGLRAAVQENTVIAARLAGTELPDPKEFLDLAALGTICDMVPLTGPNRVIAARGVELLRQSKRPGLIALKGVSRLSGRFSAGAISFGIGPRINAAGRLAEASQAFELLTTENADRAQQLAQMIDQLNESRKTIEDTVKIRCLELLGLKEGGYDQAAFVVYDPSFHAGVIGIVAQRLVELFHRPAAVLAPGEMLVGRKSVAVIKGSVRSVSGFHVASALKSLEQLLIHHGGHGEAGGFSIEEGKVEEFAAAFAELSRSTLTKEECQRKLSADAVIRFRQIDFEGVTALEQLAPFGIGNPSPLFITKDVLIESVSQVGEKHLKAKFHDDGYSLTGLCWNFEGNALLRKGERINLAYAPEFNTYQGVTSVQLNIKEVWAVSELQAYLDLACEAAKRAGAKLRELTSGSGELKVQFKDPVDLLTEYDLWTEQLITESIRSRFPAHNIVGEETADSSKLGRSEMIRARLPDGITWVIDPIDGTTNFANKIPHYGISIGVLVDGVPCAGAVYNPPYDEMFTAIRGKGAFLNGRPIRVTAKPRLRDAVVATGFSYDRRKVWPEVSARFAAALLSSRDLRRWGAASLDCCYVACGRFDAYFESNIGPWDIAAGHLIVCEAGGEGQDFLAPAREPFRLPCPNYGCGSGGSFAELLTCLQNEEIID